VNVEPNGPGGAIRRGRVVFEADFQFTAEGSRKSPSRRHEKERSMSDVVVKDSNGNRLADGDSVTVIKDLKVKGTSVTLKRGTMVKNIRLTDDPDLIECNAEKVKGLVLRTEFLKKA